MKLESIFRADRIGCDVSGVSACASVARKFFTGYSDNYFTHPQNERRIAALGQKRLTPHLRGGMRHVQDLWTSLDITGKYTDAELLPIALRAKQLLERYQQLHPSESQRWLNSKQHLLSLVFIGSGICVVIGAGTILVCSGKALQRLLRKCKRIVARPLINPA